MRSSKLEAVFMQSDHSLTLTLSLCQMEREPIGAAAYRSPDHELIGARWMFPLLAQSGERIEVRGNFYCIRTAKPKGGLEAFENRCQRAQNYARQGHLGFDLWNFFGACFLELGAC